MKSKPDGFGEIFCFAESEIKSALIPLLQRISHAAKRISHGKAIFHPSVRTDLTEKAVDFRQRLFLGRGRSVGANRQFLPRLR